MAEDRYKYFRIEAREILDQFGRGALDLEKGTPAPETVARLLRLAHTLKGAARVVKQGEIADRAHAIEDALAPFRDSPPPIPRDRLDLVFSLLDDMNRLVASMTQGPAPVSAANERIEPSIAAFRPASDELDALLAGVVEAHVQLGATRPTLTRVDDARRLVDLVASHLARPREADGGRAFGDSSAETVRSLANDLRATLSALERDLSYAVDRIDVELRQVRAAAERLRLTPAGALFTLLERAVRDTARSLGKQVVFEASGSDVRVDTFVLTVVQSALLQIVRNAVAHGIEGARERSAARKATEGRVTLRVSQRGRLVSFECRDDGRGIDLDAVRRVVQQKKPRPGEGQALQKDDLLRLLLEGGISTSGRVTEVSGRGIGLDVVREAVERLGGEASLRTEAGIGTVVEMIVPVSITAFHALTVQAAGTTAIIPLSAVRRTVRLSDDEIVRTERGESVVIDGQAIPLGSLSRLVALPHSSQARPSRSAVVVEAEAGVAAIGVERIVGTQSIVMRPLPELAPAMPIVAGVALDAEGDPRVVLDPERLVLDAREVGPPLSPKTAARAHVLVVDDSLTTRMLERSILESAGYDVDVAVSGDEALEKARAARYALFLVDVEMPGMDGFTFIERVRADAELRHVPAILVTSRTSAEDRQRGEAVGAQAYIVKSEFDQGVLLDRIRGLVS
jgi:two-component system chemotaxis sensor kinase CheA